MPKPLVIFQRLAVKEYQSYQRRYAAVSPALAERFRLAVRAAYGRIRDEPEFLPFVDRTYRRSRVMGFPHLLIFRERQPGVFMIVAVFHTSRRPGYWRRRK